MKKDNSVVGIFKNIFFTIFAFFYRSAICLAAEKKSKGFMIGLVIGHIAKVQIIDDNTIKSIKQKYKDFSSFSDDEIRAGIHLAKFVKLEKEVGYNEFCNLVSKHDNASLEKATKWIKTSLGKYCDESTFDSINSHIRLLMHDKQNLNNLLVNGKI